MMKRALTLATVLVLPAALAVAAQDPATPVELKEGDKAPAFAMMGSDGKIHQASDYKGKTIVLAWFPKAFTGG